MDPVRYRLLGTTQAIRPDGTAVPVGGARLRALLSVLALRAGRTVPTGVLVDEVWGAEPPADAVGALQALVGRLRRALGADAVASADGGYRLTAAPDDVDLGRFDRLTGDGLRALADGDPAKAAAVLDDALALWRGPALADLPDRTAEAAPLGDPPARRPARPAHRSARPRRGRAGAARADRPVRQPPPWTSSSRHCGCAPCATPAAPPRPSPPTRTYDACSPTGSAPNPAPNCAPCTPSCSARNRRRRAVPRAARATCPPG